MQKLGRENRLWLYYFDARWYDPNLGRFITEDPARDGGNWFAYCGNNPLNSTDPTGLAGMGDLGRYDATGETSSGSQISGNGNTGNKVAPTKPGVIAPTPPIVTPQPPTPPNPNKDALKIAGSLLKDINDASDSVLRAIYGNDIADELEGLSLIDKDRVIHILLGDETGGGHLWPGEAGKTPFPKDWTPQKIITVISDVATGPDSILSPSGKSVVKAIGTIEGVTITVIMKLGKIITGYPTNLPRNE